MFKNTPMFQKTRIATVFAAATSLMLITAGCATKTDYTMTPEALAEHLVFKSDSFALEQATQVSYITGRDLLVQDETQKLCSQVALSGKKIDADTAARVTALAQASLRYPSSGIAAGERPFSKKYSKEDLKLGNWENGRVLAWSGFGWRTAHNVDDHTKSKVGATCYNCHALATDRT